MVNAMENLREFAIFREELIAVFGNKAVKDLERDNLVVAQVTCLEHGRHGVLVDNPRKLVFVTSEVGHRVPLVSRFRDCMQKTSRHVQTDIARAIA